MSLLFSFAGRIGRGKFWLGVLCQVVLSLVALALIFMLVPMESVVVVGPDGQPVLDALGQPQIDYANPALMPAYIIYGITLLLSLWWFFAISIKRMHDRGRSGWWVLLMFLLMFVIVGSIWWLVDLGILEGEEGPNQWGPNPVAQSA
jgi:uncharacterized membrane protein YhaH (DUF805 family)